MSGINFNISEIVAMIGLAQCVYLLVYMAFRSGDFTRAAVPFLYFFVLAAAFLLDFGQRFLMPHVPYYALVQWGTWFYGPPLAALLVYQLLHITRAPPVQAFWVLFLIPAAWFAARYMALQDQLCLMPDHCPMMNEWLVVMGIGAGVLSMLAVWSRRDIVAELHSQKVGKDRYWLVLTLILVTLGFLAATLLGLTPVMNAADAEMTRKFLGIACAYLAGTSLFRIYPQAMYIVDRAAAPAQELNADEIDIARKIEHKIEMEKVYHEPGYNRADLARELEMPESTVSKIINIRFGKTFPQLLNEKRVEDAKRLLTETDAAVKIVASEVGFNSIASFNRVFREISGQSPSQYRENKKA